MNSKNSILDGSLLVRLDLGDARISNQGFATSRANLARLAYELLLYDVVIIPSKDMAIIPIIAGWLGTDLLREVLEVNALRFAHLDSLLCYAGNGNGVCAFTIGEGESKAFEWWQKAAFGPMDTAIGLQLDNVLANEPAEIRQSIFDLAVRSSTAVSWDNNFFENQIAAASYLDIMHDAALRQYVLEKQPPSPTGVKLKWLAGVEPNQMRLSSLRPLSDAVDLVLLLAELNLEMALGSHLGDVDVAVTTGADRIVAGKLARAGVPANRLDRFVSVLEIEDLPDVEQGILDGNLEFREIWKLRQSRDAIDFRRWLQKASASDAAELSRLYVSAISKHSWVASLPARIVRFALVTGIGLAEPITGLVLGAADTFLVEKLLGGYSPKLFSDRLRSLPSSGEI